MVAQRVKNLGIVIAVALVTAMVWVQSLVQNFHCPLGQKGMKENEMGRRKGRRLFKEKTGIWRVTFEYH